MSEDVTHQEAFVLEFLDDWSKSDARSLADRFTDDGYYRNMPAPTARGREAVRALIAQLFEFASFRMEILGVSSRGNTVYTERIDHLTFTDTSKGTLPLPVFGVFELEGGLIKEWREYFDLATVEIAADVTFR